MNGEMQAAAEQSHSKCGVCNQAGFGFMNLCVCPVQTVCTVYAEGPLTAELSPQLLLPLECLLSSS